MNTFKKTGGFTLVELIIVIAILAILSSVAVAGYSSYITKANDSAAQTWLNEVKTHVTLANAKVGGDVTIEVTADGKGVKLTFVAGISGDFRTDIVNAYGAGAVSVVDDDNTSDNILYLSFTKAAAAWGNSSYKIGAKSDATSSTGWTADAPAFTMPSAE